MSGSLSEKRIVEWCFLSPSSVSGCTSDRRAIVSRPRYRMLASRMEMKRPRRLMHCCSPRRGDAVVQVVVGVVLVEDEPGQCPSRLVRGALPAGRVDGEDAEHERRDRGQQADVLLVEQLQDLVSPLLGPQDVVRLSVEAERGQGSLLAHVRFGEVVGEKLYHV
eukprot:scaffold12002_cov115-Isochrysis_galbana.AAC.9